MYSPFPQKQYKEETRGTASPSWTFMPQPTPSSCTYTHTHQPQGLSPPTGLVRAAPITVTAPSSSSQPQAGLKSRFLPFLPSSRLFTAFAPALIAALPRELEQKDKPEHWSRLSPSNEYLQPAPLSPILAIARFK